MILIKKYEEGKDLGLSEDSSKLDKQNFENFRIDLGSSVLETTTGMCQQKLL